MTVKFWMKIYAITGKNTSITTNSDMNYDENNPME